MKTIKFQIAAVAAFILSVFSTLGQSGGGFDLSWNKIAGGGGTSTGGVFAVSGTIGQHDAGGPMTSGNYSLTGGFWSLISVVQTTGAPSLAISHSGNSVIVSWPSASPGFVLQQNATLSPGNWTPASAFTVSDDGTTKSITITAPAGNLFFRLKQ